MPEWMIAMFRLTALQMQLAADTFFPLTKADQPARIEERAVPPPETSEAKIDAAMAAIEMKLIAGRELGFQCLLRTNFPSDTLRDIAAAALEAARDAE
jgi:hypothetical protein